MRLQAPFETITSSVDGEVLSVVARADAWFGAPAIARILGDRSVPGVRASLKRLAAQGILELRRAGRVEEYRLNGEHLAAGPIRELARLDDELLRRLRAEIERFSRAPLSVALFGSAARGTMREDSDIDVFLMVSEDDDEMNADIDRLMRRITAWTGNDARAFVVSDAWVLERGASEPVIADIAREGRWIIGDRRMLERPKKVPVR